LKITSARVGGVQDQPLAAIEFQQLLIGVGVRHHEPFFGGTTKTLGRRANTVQTPRRFTIKSGEVTIFNVVYLQ
jgi:hypothetical protein